MDTNIDEFGEMGAEDDLKFLREGNDNVDPKVGEEENEEEKDKTEDEGQDEDEVKEDEEETEEDNKEDDEKEEEENEEDDEKELLGGLVTAKDIKAKYPDIFKKFPELRSVIYREKQYSDIFTDPKEAETVSKDAQAFHDIESDLTSGESKPLFEALKKIDGMDFGKFASKLLPALKEVDEATYMKVLAVPFKMVLRSALAHGISKKDKNLELSAQHLHNFIFDNLDLDSKTDFENESKEEVNPEEKKYRQKLDELDKRDYQAAKVDVDKTWMDGVRTAFFDKFDPDNTLSKWTKEKMFESAINELNTQLTADARYMRLVQSFWQKAKASGYSSESKSRIVTTALARAKQIIPEIRTKIRNEALAKDKAEGKKTFKVVKKDKPREQKKSGNKFEGMSDLDIIRSA